MICLGIDVGGTNTDAVMVDGKSVLHAVKMATIEEVGDGIVMVLRRLLAEGAVDPARIDAVMIGTTHFTNAVVQRRHLARIAAVRIGLPAAATLPPFVDWPADLRGLVQGPTFMIRGGHELDGLPIAPFDKANRVSSRADFSFDHSVCVSRHGSTAAARASARCGASSSPTADCSRLTRVHRKGARHRRPRHSAHATNPPASN